MLPLNLPYLVTPTLGFRELAFLLMLGESSARDGIELLADERIYEIALQPRHLQTSAKWEATLT